MSFLSNSFVFILFCNNVFCQYSFNEDIINKTVLIEFDNGNSGSGFLFQDSFDIFLVTARHVVLNEVLNDKGKVIDYKLQSQNGTIKFYARESDKSEVNEMKCDFLKAYQSGNLKYSLTDDVLMVRLAKVKSDEYFHTEYLDFIFRQGKSTRINTYLPGAIGFFDDTQLGNDIFIFGYPKSLGLNKDDRYDFNRPLLRKGTLAGRNVESKTIIIDCPSFGGNSGGPVIEITNKGKIKLIGIVVSFLPYTEYWINPTYKIRNIEIDNSGYSVVEPIDKIIDLLNKF